MVIHAGRILLEEKKKGPFLIAGVSLSVPIILALSFFKNSLYLLSTIFVLHQSRFSRLSSDLRHVLFQLNGFKFFAH